MSILENVRWTMSMYYYVWNRKKRKKIVRLKRWESYLIYMNICLHNFYFCRHRRCPCNRCEVSFSSRNEYVWEGRITVKRKRRSELARWWFYISTTENRKFVVFFFLSFVLCILASTNTKRQTNIWNDTWRGTAQQRRRRQRLFSLLRVFFFFFVFFSPSFLRVFKTKPQSTKKCEGERESKGGISIHTHRHKNDLSSVTNVNVIIVKFNYFFYLY